MARDTKDSIPVKIDAAAILRASPVGVFVVDASGAPVFTNDAAEDILGQVDCSVLTVKPERFVSPISLED